jgi:putative colanic acid biosynthesis glycosyltransferase
MIEIKLSIVVVSLNTKNEFIKTIGSINSQVYKNYEIIVIDGDSSDGTVDEILKVKENFSNFIIEKDKGIYDAMNKGIRLSKGEWIFFLNSGDIFYNKNILEKIFSNYVDDKDVIFGDTVIESNNLKYFSLGREFKNNTVIMPFCHQSCLIKKNILIQKLFNLDYKLSSDFNLMLSLFLSNKIFFKINEIFSLVDGSGISNLHRQKVLSENINTLKQFDKKKFIYKLYLLKVIEFLKTLIKSLLPKLIINIILKIKYRKRII